MAFEFSKIERYLALPYTREVVSEDDGTWFARVIELPGCMTVGDTQAEALDNLNDAMSAWIESMLEHGERVPEPGAQ